MNRKECLQAALDAVSGRPKAYGAPEDNFSRIAALWQVYVELKFGVVLDIGPVDVALMMDLLKTARLIETPGLEDSWTDKAGYTACGAEVATQPVDVQGTRKNCTVGETRECDNTTAPSHNMAFVCPTPDIVLEEWARLGPMLPTTNSYYCQCNDCKAERAEEDRACRAFMDRWSC